MKCIVFWDYKSRRRKKLVQGYKGKMAFSYTDNVVID